MEYYMASPETEEKLINFLKGRKPSLRTKAGLAHEILKEMGKPTDCISSVCMMHSLQDLYDQREDYVGISNAN